MNVPISEINAYMPFFKTFDERSLGMTDQRQDQVVSDRSYEDIFSSCGICFRVFRHGSELSTTCCQLHTRPFWHRQIIVVESRLRRPVPIIKDVISNNPKFVRIIQTGGYTSVDTVGGSTLLNLKKYTIRNISIRRHKTQNMNDLIFLFKNNYYIYS